jgi:hypothetical protein
MEEAAKNKLMVSGFKNFITKLEDKNLLEILQNIKSGKYESEINSIRYALNSGKIQLANGLKMDLIAFTASGTYSKQRKAKFLTSYSQIINLDFDHIPVEEIENLVAKINECQYTMASFISPSGEGIKIFIIVNSFEEQHAMAYDQVANFYKNLTGFDFDPKCKDITRLCFVSNDPNTYINENSNVFEVIEVAESIINIVAPQIIKELPIGDLLDKCLKFTEQKETYQNGNRNNFIYLFASNANRYGIVETDTLDFCTTNFDLDEKEIINSVNSAYKNQMADYAKFADLANKAVSPTNHSKAIISNNTENDDSYLINTPTIPDFVYDNLPKILKDGADVFKSQREKDVFLTGALTILSGCIPNVSGVYGGRTVYPQLFAFILAPAASGKGVLQSAKELADKYHSATLETSVEQKKEYDFKIAEYRRAQRYKKKDDDEDEVPEEPSFKVVYIPANASNSSLIQHLQKNDGRGIICETEADTMGQAFKNDWGSYSDLLRKAFHHEKISISRKTNNEYFEINNPQLAVALSGTPQQVFSIISSAEDGLFSRFLFYIFKTDSIWMDPSPYGNHINLTDHFSKLSITVYEMVLFLNDAKTEISLSQEQWTKFNIKFNKYLQDISTFVSEDAQGVVKRLGLILYRFCMVFTSLRKFEALELATNIECLDDDFESALQLVEVYLQHSIIMFTNLPKQEEQGPFKSGENKKQFFDALPNRFSRKQAVELAMNFNIAERTVGSLLKNCLGSLLKQPEYGIYEKKINTDVVE